MGGDYSVGGVGKARLGYCGPSFVVVIQTFGQLFTGEGPSLFDGGYRVSYPGALLLIKVMSHGR